jgi:hypothetical protein
MKQLCLWAALLAAPSSLVAQSPSFDQTQSFSFTTPKSDTFSFNLNAGLTETAFSHRLRVPITPSEILQTDFMTATGLPLQFRMLADGEHGLIIGTPVDGLQLELLTRLNADGQPQYVVIGRQGNVLYDLTADDLFLTDLQFGDYCFTLEALEQAGVPLNIELAVDVSGSMHEAMPEVQRSFSTFVGQVPLGAQCRTTLFNDKNRELQPRGAAINQDGTFNCADFDDPAQLANEMVASGGTNIVTPLTAMYQRLEQATEQVNLAVIISDGLGENDRSSPAFQRLRVLRDQAVAATGVYTVVLWRGQYSQDYPLGDLADASVIGPQSSTDTIADFFTQSEALLRAQRVVTPVSCG